MDTLHVRSGLSSEGRSTKAIAATAGFARAARRDSRTPVIIALAFVLAGSLGAFAHVVEDYLTGDPLVDWDVRFALWLHERASDPLIGLFKVITLAGNAAVLGLVSAAAAFVLLRRGRANDAALVLLSLGGAGLLNAAFKLAFQRPRPESAFVQLDAYSFPSGHAAASTAAFLAAAFLAATRVRGLRRRSGIVLTALVAAAAVAFSRLYLGAHYLSDVLAGSSLGLAWTTVCLILYVAYGRRDVLDLLPARIRRRLESIKGDQGATVPR